MVTSVPTYSVEVRDATLSVDLGTVRIDVVTAKRPGGAWRAAARTDIARAREAYQRRWGPVPIWDDLDTLDTTFNYIAYVHYCDARGRSVVEAVSNRVVTVGAEDLYFYRSGDTLLGNLIRSQLYDERGLPERPIASDSRFGGIPPADAHANAHTVETWAALKLRVAADCREMGIDYAVGQLRPELLRVLTRNGMRFDVPPGEQTLELPSGSLKLDRSSPHVINHLLNYPGYFLQARGIAAVVQRCIDTGVLGTEEFQQHTGLRSTLDLLKPRNAKNLRTLIWSDTAAGDTLRAALIREVPDGTFVSISHVDQYVERAHAVLARAAQAEPNRP